MARNIDELKKQYNTGHNNMATGAQGRGPGGPGRGGPMARGLGGKPKDTSKTVKRLWKYMASYKFKLALVMLLMVTHTLTALFGSFMLAPIIDKIALTASPDAEVEVSALEEFADKIITSLTKTEFLSGIFAEGRLYEVLTYMIAGIVILLTIYLVGALSGYFQSRLMLSITQGSLERIRNELFAKLQSLPLKYFDNESTGDVMSRFTNDVDNIGMMLDNSLVSLISGSISLVGTFVFMITTNWVLTMVTVLFVPIFVFGGAAISKRGRRFYKGQQASLGAVNGYIEESVTGQKVVKVFNHESVCEDEFLLLNNDLRDTQFKAQFYGGIMGPVMGNTSQITYAITVGIGGIMMITSGFTPGALTVFANYSRQFAQPINMISMQMSNVFSALAGAERVFKVMDTSPEIADSTDAVEMGEIKGEVILKNVNFGYTEERLILKNLSVVARPGEKVAFVGSTGAGKTTITNLINRFYDVGSGEITIDGVPIKGYTRESLRENIAMVLQDTHLFSGTIMENIRYGRLDATDEDVIAAAKTASAHSFIMRLSKGYETEIMGDGQNLSQGQRQLLNIARAAISKAPILVLDEATSSVDTRTEMHIEHGMDRLMKERTTFVIAHRLSTVRNADKIIVLEKGEIMEEGTHDELLKLKGRYYELYTGKKELD